MPRNRPSAIKVHRKRFMDEALQLDGGNTCGTPPTSDILSPKPRRQFLSPARPCNRAETAHAKQQNRKRLGHGGGEKAVCAASIVVSSHDLARVVYPVGLGRGRARHVKRGVDTMVQQEAVPA